MLSTFTVSDTKDDGIPGSFRWAIAQVDADPNPGVDTIDFAIQGQGPFTIYTNEPLPAADTPGSDRWLQPNRRQRQYADDQRQRGSDDRSGWHLHL